MTRPSIPATSAALPGAPPPPPAPRPVGARVATTIVAVVMFVLAGRIPVPGVDADAVWQVAETGSAAPGLASVVAMGIQPFVGAFLLVELVALAIPRWRPLRRHARARLDRWGARLGVVLAVVQGVTMARWLQHLDLRGIPAVPQPGAFFVVTAALSLVAGTAISWMLAKLVTARGLGNGFSVLILVDAVRSLWPFAASLPFVIPGLPHRVAVQVVVGLAAVVGVALATLLSPRRPEATGGLPLRSPAGGLLPAWGSATLLALLVLPRNLGWVHGGSTYDEVLVSPAFRGLLLVVLGAACSFAFVRPRTLVEAWRRAGPSSLEPAALQARAARTAAAAAAVTVVFNVLVSLARDRVDRAFLDAQVVVPALAVVPLVIAVAILLDLAEDWRWWRSHADAVVAWPLHDVTLVGPAAALLASSRIPHHFRAVHHRTLLQFFGPLISVDVLVPPDRAADAERALSPLREA